MLRSGFRSSSEAFGFLFAGLASISCFRLLHKLMQRLGVENHRPQFIMAAEFSEKVYVGAIDQGTTSSRFILFDRSGNMVGSASKEHKQLYPNQGAPATCSLARWRWRPLL